MYRQGLYYPDDPSIIRNRNTVFSPLIDLGYVERCKIVDKHLQWRYEGFVSCET